MFDVAKVRKDFPILEEQVYGKRLVYLDNGATTQRPLQVIEKMNEYYLKYNSNVHRGVHFLSNKCTDANVEAREIVRKFIHAGSDKEIIFTRGTTESINLVAEVKELKANPHRRAKGAVIDLGNDVEGYLRVSEISADRIEDATTRLNAGDEVEALITNIDRKNRSIQLSIRAKDAAEARDALDRLNADATAATGTTNLGALLKAKLEQR